MVGPEQMEASGSHQTPRSIVRKQNSGPRARATAATGTESAELRKTTEGTADGDGVSGASETQQCGAERGGEPTLVSPCGAGGGRLIRMTIFFS